MNCVWTLSNWSMFWPLKTMFPALRVFLLFWQHDLFFEETKNQTNATVASANSSDQARAWLFWAQWGNLKLWGTCRRYDMKSGTASCLLKHLVWSGFCRGFYRWCRCVPRSQGHFFAFDSTTFFQEKKNQTNATAASDQAGGFSGCLAQWENLELWRTCKTWCSRKEPLQADGPFPWEPKSAYCLSPVRWTPVRICSFYLGKGLDWRCNSSGAVP